MLRKTFQQFTLARPYLIATAVCILLFWPTWFRLIQEWLKWEQVLAHGLPTFLIFLGLLVVHPPRPRTSGPQGIPIVGGSLLLLAVVGWALLELVRIDTLAYLMLPAGLLLVCWTLYGLRAAISFLPHVLLLSLSLPIWADMVPFLVELASVVVGDLVGLLGITALIEGANITLPYGRLVIADGCSGIRYLAVSILLGTITAILNDFRWKGWLAAITASVLLALLINWVRITALVLIAYYSNMESDLVKEHETFGWLVFAAFVVPVMLLAPVHRRTPAPVGAAIPTSGKPFIFIVAGLLIGPLGISIAHSAATQSPPWAPSNSDLTTADPDRLPLAVRLPPHMEHDVWRTTDGHWISLAQSVRSASNEKLVPYLPRPLDTGNWFLAEEHEQPPIRIYQNLASRQQIAVYQHYLVGRYRANSYWAAKLLQIPATLHGQGRFAFLTLQAPCGPRDCTDAIGRLTQQIDSGIVTMDTQEAD